MPVFVNEEVDQRLPYATYILRDPVTKKMRYVGKTKSALKARFRRHLRDVRETETCGAWKDKTHRANWIRSLLAAGVEPEMWEIARYSSLQSVNGAEKLLIRGFRAVDTPETKLTNATDGGDGGIVARKPACSDEEVLHLYRQGLGTKTIARRLKTCAKRVSRVVSKEPKHSATKPVLDDLGNSYVSVSAAARAYGVTLGAVSNNLRGRAKSAAGHVFKYAR